MNSVALRGVAWSFKAIPRPANGWPKAFLGCNEDLTVNESVDNLRSADAFADCVTDFTRETASGPRRDILDKYPTGLDRLVARKSSIYTKVRIFHAEGTLGSSLGPCSGVVDPPS